MYTNYNSYPDFAYSNYYSYPGNIQSSYSTYPSSNQPATTSATDQSDDRFLGAGIVAPLLLGGIAGAALARRPYYGYPYPYPYPYYPYSQYPPCCPYPGY